MIDEDERCPTAFQCTVRHLHSSRAACATDDELLDVLIPACTGAPSGAVT
ncbi:hypothetical protein [Kineococcus auxinigenes]